ncbi:MAG: DNA polymerase III subunit delta' [Clostridia bacterium]|nr:DNA polymerase III subunit delta' [Clostridia bacterium]
MSFNEIIGNNENKQFLISTIKNEKVVHSYLFFGTDGIGKKMFATQFAKMILCNDKLQEKPCNKCKACMEFNSGNNPDFFLVEPEGNSIKINQVRQLMKTTLEKPIESSKKVYIINNADTMTKEAQNGILKTLEEPQEYVVIILIASSENNILTTIKSRCTKLYFNNLSNDEIKQYINKKLNINVYDDEIVKLCNGSIAKAEEVMQKQDLLEKVKHFIANIEKISKLNFIRQSQLLNDNKEDVLLILEYIYIILFYRAKRVTNINGYINAMKVVQEAINKLAISNNFDMTIDYMLIKIWEEINEKNNRG